MKMKHFKKSSIMMSINNSLINLPTPTNISSMWNFGSILGLCLMIQILTGLFLTMHYCPNIELAFDSISHICRNVNYGWLIRMIHSNTASTFFLCMYIHMSRGLYYSSYLMKETWTVGVTILLFMMMTAFLGYVLPWGQMSFWGATVITNLLSAIPYLGKNIVEWIWGGFSINNATLTRFYTMHFITPFLIMALMMIHLIFLHNKGSSNQLGTNSNIDKIPFHPYFSIKDWLSMLMIISMMSMIVLMNPYLLSDPENFLPANPLVTPIHIQPEWYFLFAYAILRSIPNKLGGVITMMASIMIFYFLPFIKNKVTSNQFNPMNKMMYWTFILTVILLTWVGAQPVENPYIFISQMLTSTYFTSIIMNIFMFKLQNL